MRYRMARIYLSWTRFVISLTKTRELHIGTKVIYQGREYWISNLAFRENLCKIRSVRDSRYSKIVPRKDVKKVRSLSNFTNDATAWWNWYRRSWLSIDARAMANGKTLSSIRILGHNRALGRK